MGGNAHEDEGDDDDGEDEDDGEEDEDTPATHRTGLAAGKKGRKHVPIVPAKRTSGPAPASCPDRPKAKDHDPAPAPGKKARKGRKR